MCIRDRTTNGNVQGGANGKRTADAPAAKVAVPAGEKGSLLTRIGRGLKSLVTRGPSRQH